MVTRQISFMALLLAALCLTSCEALPTQWMPNGYTYNDNTPLSSPAPSRPWHKQCAPAKNETLTGPDVLTASPPPASVVRGQAPIELSPPPIPPVVETSTHPLQ